MHTHRIGVSTSGGDGSLSTALQLQGAGLPIVGLPKTIDNDLEHQFRGLKRRELSRRLHLWILCLNCFIKTQPFHEAIWRKC